MRCLIIGCTGQDGYLLSNLLKKKQVFFIGTKLQNNTLDKKHSLYNSNLIFSLDVRDTSQIVELVLKYEINLIYYLAGITTISDSLNNPNLTLEINYTSYRELLLNLRDLNFNGQIIYASSTEIFDKNEPRINENSKFFANNPYTTSKLNSTLIKNEFSDLNITNAIMSNHESSLRSEKFVIGKLARGLAKIYLNQDKKIKFGNIDISKDWSYAPEIIEALFLLAENKKRGNFILASGQLSNLKELIKFGFEYIGKNNWQEYVEIDSSLIRKGEKSNPIFDISKAQKELNWYPTKDFKVWLPKIIDYHLQTN